MTVLGTSAEHGDDGAVGRGNRVNGVSPYYKPVSLEAASGKNPVSHVGKLCNVLAFITAKRIFGEVANLQEVYVKFVSKIGSPIDKPILSTTLYAAESQLTVQEEQRIVGIIQDELVNHLGSGKLRDEIVKADYDHGPLLYLLALRIESLSNNVERSKNPSQGDLAVSEPFAGWFSPTRKTLHVVEGGKARCGYDLKGKRVVKQKVTRDIWHPRCKPCFMVADERCWWCGQKPYCTEQCPFPACKS